MIEIYEVNVDSQNSNTVEHEVSECLKRNEISVDDVIGINYHLYCVHTNHMEYGTITRDTYPNTKVWITVKRKDGE